MGTTVETHSGETAGTFGVRNSIDAVYTILGGNYGRHTKSEMTGNAVHRLRFLLADDHELLRDAVRPLLLKLAPETCVVEASTYGEVADILNAAGTAADRFDLILLDLGMPGADEQDILMGVRRIRELAPDAPIVIFSSTENPTVIRNAFGLGVRGYVPKTTRGLAFIRALKLVLEGDLYIPAALIALEAPAPPAPPSPAPNA